MAFTAAEDEEKEEEEGEVDEEAMTAAEDEEEELLGSAVSGEQESEERAEGQTGGGMAGPWLVRYDACLSLRECVLRFALKCALDLPLNVP